jgi:hypothetical protein
MDSKEATSPHGLILERLWGSYATTDDRRRKAFYYLFSSLAAFALVWASQEQSFQLPFVGTKVEFAVALALSPAFILVLMTRYLYLCAHSLLSYTTYLDHFFHAYHDELKKLDLSYGVLFNLLKQRDITENLNCFLFPMRPVRGYDDTFDRRVKNGVLVLANLAILLNVIVPILAYIAGVIWVMYNGLPLLGPWLFWPLLLAVYIPMALLLVASPLYFYYRATPALHRVREAYGERRSVSAAAPEASV